MVNRNNRIEGQNISEHPLEGAEVFVKGATVLAVKTDVGGVVVTPEGEMRFQAGDYIVTDNPPTHAWPVREAVFELTYVVVEPIAGDEDNVDPTTPEMEAAYVMGLENGRAEAPGSPIEDAEELKTSGDAPEGAETPDLESHPQADDSVEAKTIPEVTQKPPIPADQVEPEAKPAKKATKGGRTVDSESTKALGG